MHLHPNLAAIHDCGHVRCDDCIYTCSFGSIKRPMCRLYIFLIQNDIQCEICLYPILAADSDYLSEIFRLEIVCGMGPHVEVADSEIY